MSIPLFDIKPEVATALREHRPVVALESSIIAHGLPRPANIETALLAEAAIRSVGAVPATIAVLMGRPTIGLNEKEITFLARLGGAARKASRRDLAAAIAQTATAGTTVSATMYLAHRCGIRFFATGGIGGVHPAASGSALDISADLIELGRTPVAVVCAGAKSILDLPATLEVLETQGVPVLGFRTDELPAFYLRECGLKVSARVDDPTEAAAVLAAHWELGGAGAVLALPLPESSALNPTEFNEARIQAEQMAQQRGIRGPALTPFLLAKLAEITKGRTIVANTELVIANAQLAGQVARAMEGK